MKESQRKGLISVHVAVALFGFVGLFAKLVDLPAVIIVLGRVFPLDFSAFKKAENSPGGEK